MKYFYTAIAFMSVFLIYQITTTLLLNNRIDNTAPQYAIGAPDADLTIVEFLSFNCPYCQEIHPTILSAIEQDSKATYIPRPIGASGDPESAKKAALAYSAGNQGKFADSLSILFERTRPIDEAFITEFADSLALDPAQLNTDFNAQKTKDLIEKNNRLFSQAKATATPTFIIGGKLFYVPTKQMPTAQDFLDMFTYARKM